LNVVGGTNIRRKYRQLLYICRRTYYVRSWFCFQIRSTN